MKIIAFLNAYTKGKSGADVIFVEIYKRIKNTQLTIITSAAGKEFCRQNGLEAEFIVTTKEKGFKNVIYTYLQRIVLAFIKINTIKSADIIYSTSDALPDVLPAFFLAKKLKKPLIGNIFHIIPINRFISFATQKIAFQLYKWQRALCFVDNDILANDLIKSGFKKNNIVLRYPGINFGLIEKAKPVPGYDAISMIRIHESKGIFDLIEIWQEVIKRIPKATLGIIGTGDEMFIDRMNQKIYENNLSNNIKLLGYLSDTEAFQLIKGTKIFLFPSHEEGFGMAVGEALAAGTKVIAYDLPAFKNTFKKFITTVSCFNKKLFAQNTIKLLTVKKMEIEKMDLKKFSWEKVVVLESNILNI
jgi:glycosyltransferase involved in cell wall biosynthesis